MLERSSEQVHLCLTHALSRSNDPGFNGKCDHEHIATNELMDRDHMVLHSLEKHILDVKPAEDRDEFKWTFDTASHSLDM